MPSNNNIIMDGIEINDFVLSQLQATTTPTKEPLTGRGTAGRMRWDFGDRSSGTRVWELTTRRDHRKPTNQSVWDRERDSSSWTNGNGNDCPSVCLTNMDSTLK